MEPAFHALRQPLFASSVHRRKGDPAMNVSRSDVVERIARVLAGQRLSANAQGNDPSAGEAVDRTWQEHVNDALAVLRTLREPDERMAAAGDPAVWERMVLAALPEGENALV
jgi:hypothetical protein